MFENNKLKAIELLKLLIQTPSISGEEDLVASHIEKWLNESGIETKRSLNNVWALNKHYDSQKPTILINSHHDTVKPNKSYTNDPFDAIIDGDIIFGLGSNDAGASLVSMMSLFLYYYNSKNLKYNLIFAASAEEEISGKLGIAHLINKLPPIDFAVIGEPTEMNLAIAERGLIVIDAYAKGTSGHSAHDNTENPIYTAINDISLIKNYTFKKKPNQLGKIKVSVTQINAGTQHNIVPSVCHFVIDARVPNAYTNLEVFNIIDKNTKSKLKARSLRLNSSSIDLDHPIVKAARKLKIKTFYSPTISDQALLKCPSVKIGPGVSKRSHMANEYVKISEIKEGVNLYISLFNQLL